MIHFNYLIAAGSSVSSVTITSVIIPSVKITTVVVPPVISSWGAVATFASVGTVTSRRPLNVSFRFWQHHFTREFQFSGFLINSNELHLYFFTFLNEIFGRLYPFPSHFRNME